MKEVFFIYDKESHVFIRNCETNELSLSENEYALIAWVKGEAKPVFKSQTIDDVTRFANAPVPAEIHPQNMNTSLASMGYNPDATVPVITPIYQPQPTGSSDLSKMGFEAKK